MLSERVTSDDIARVIARATGIPVQTLLRGERERLVHVGIPLLDGKVESADYVSADGRRSKGSSCWSRPRYTRCQRCGAHFKGWAAGAYAPCSLVLIPGPDGCRKSMLLSSRIFSVTDRGLLD